MSQPETQQTPADPPGATRLNVSNVRMISEMCMPAATGTRATSGTGSTSGATATSGTTGTTSEPTPPRENAPRAPIEQQQRQQQEAQPQTPRAARYGRENYTRETYLDDLRRAGYYGVRVVVAQESILAINAHVSYHEDAEGLVEAGIDGLAHLVRDREMDEAVPV